MNSFSVLGLAMSFALRSTTSADKEAICSSFCVKRSMVRLAMTSASSSASLCSSRASSLDKNRVYTDSKARFKYLISLSLITKLDSSSPFYASCQICFLFSEINLPSILIWQSRPLVCSTSLCLVHACHARPIPEFERIFT